MSSGVPGVTGTPRGKYWALVGLSGEIGGLQGVPPPWQSELDLGKGGGAPLFLSLPTSFPLLVGVLLLLGGGLLLGAP